MREVLRRAFVREQHGDVFLGVIDEGPGTWTVRPVADVFYEKEFSQFETVSALVGFLERYRKMAVKDGTKLER